MNEAEELPTSEAAPRRAGASGPFVAAMVAIGVLLGFSLALIAVEFLGNTSLTSSQLYDEGLVTSLFERVSPAVVEVNVGRGIGGLASSGTGTGSGFLVDDEGHIITNHHVVAGATEVTVTLFDGRTLEARKLGSSPADDLALLQVDPAEVEGIAPLDLADSDKARPGQMAIAVGTPFRQFNSISVGVVSGTGRGPSSVLRRPIPDMIQTDAALNPGNSGGPLLDSRGEVLGVTSSVRTEQSRSIEEYRIGFAVPSNTVKDLMPELLKSQVVRRPWLGISGGPVTSRLTEELGIPEGVYVTGVFPDSPAEQAGLVPFRSLRGGARGDVITTVDGEPVSSVEDMVTYFNTLKPGQDVTLSVFREDKTVELQVTLAEWPDT